MLLIEDALLTADVDRILALRADDAPAAYHVLVPVDTERNLLVAMLDDLALGDLRHALRETRSKRSKDNAEAEAQHALDATVGALRAAGAQADGALTPDDPVPAVRATVERLGADEVYVVTEPHLVEESFNRDWASRARGDVGVPLLHVFSGTDRVG